MEPERQAGCVCCVLVKTCGLCVPPSGPVCGGVSEEQSDFLCQPQTEGDETEGEEGEEAHRGVDKHGVCGDWRPRVRHFHGFLSGSAAPGDTPLIIGFLILLLYCRRGLMGKSGSFSFLLPELKQIGAMHLCPVMFCSG